MNENENKITLREYCKSMNITIAHLSKMTDVSASHLYKVADDLNAEMNVSTVRKIYKGTKEKFGEGLDIHTYLNI